MSALVERARFLASGQDDPHSVTIEELCARIAELEGALEPFAKAGELAHNAHITAFVYVSDLRRARAALNKAAGDE